MRFLLVCSTLLLVSPSNAQFVLITPAGMGGRTSTAGRPPALLHDGNVLIVNGYGGAELYDANLRAFTSTGTPPVALNYGGFAIAPLPDGRAAITGAYDTSLGVRNYVLLWDRGTGSFRQITGMRSGRSGHAVVALSSELLLIVGGDAPSFDTWEMYDLLQEKWVATGFLPGPFYFTKAFVHPSGKIVFVAGGRAVIFDPTTFTFSAGFGIPPSLGGSALEMLTDGRFLVTGGNRDAPPAIAAVDTAFIFDAFTGVREDVAPMLNSRFWHAATRLPSGKILVTGGVGYCLGSCKPVVAPAEIFDPLTKRFSSAGVMNSLRFNHAPIRLNTGEVLVVGGESGSDSLPDPELYVTERGGVGRRRAVRH